MNSPADHFILDVPSLLTAAGVAVAVLAALYARWAAISAKRQANAAEAALRETQAQSAIARAELQAAKVQNEIAVHANRLEAYKAFIGFRAAINAYGPNFKREVVWHLWEHARLAEFYFSLEISTALNTAVDLAEEVKRTTDRLAEPDGYSPDQIKSLRDKRDEKYLRLAESLDTLNEEMRKVLRIAPT